VLFGVASGVPPFWSWLKICFVKVAGEASPKAGSLRNSDMSCS
jgi:hypothetical protein